jgi:hypothetical protein
MALTNGQVESFDLLKGTEIAVAETGVAYTPTYICKKNVNYAFEYKFASGGTVDAKIEIEQGNTPPATEGAASANMVIPEDAATFDASITDTLNHVKAYAPAVTRFLRAKITGQGDNAATTKLVKFNVSTIVNL